MVLTLVPAYGRDYRSAKEVKAAFETGKDFLNNRLRSVVVVTVK
jgi:hypothetical protein